MLQAVKNLEFERAAELRDQLKKLRESVFCRRCEIQPKLSISAVIPAKAGIQREQYSASSFISCSISGQNPIVDPLRGDFCELGKKPPIPVNPNSINWIPAFAGMTLFSA